jgi:uncharacterized protein YkwD
MNWLSGLLGLLFRPRPTAPAPPPIPIPVTPPPAPPPGPVTPTALDLVRADVVTAMNAARKAAGLNPLVEHPEVDDVSQSWAQEMASTIGLTHGGFSQRITATFGQVAAGEDIADGYPSAQAVVTAWMNSPPHRTHVLGNYNLVGVGIAATPAGVLYWCVDFVMV